MPTRILLCSGQPDNSHRMVILIITPIPRPRRSTLRNSLLKATQLAHQTSKCGRRRAAKPWPLIPSPPLTLALALALDLTVTILHDSPIYTPTSTLTQSCWLLYPNANPCKLINLNTIPDPTQPEGVLRGPGHGPARLGLRHDPCRIRRARAVSRGTGTSWVRVDR